MPLRSTVTGLQKTSTSSPGGACLKKRPRKLTHSKQLKMSPKVSTDKRQLCSLRAQLAKTT
eukprot:2505530-Lingulodinium_polyedra.AAC.1